MTGTELEVRQSNAVAVQDELTIDQLTGQVQKIQQAMEAVMKRGEHYGTIPNAGNKNILFKAGAEKLCLLFRLDPEYQIDSHYDEDGHFTCTVTCVLNHITSGNRMGSGVGMCTSKERKYAFVKGQPNRNLPDTYNTVLKMACKRALVAAVLNTTAASDIFTQDLEDAVDHAPPPPPPAPAPQEVYEKLVTILATAAKIDASLWGPEVVVANASRKFGRQVGDLKQLSEQEATLIITGAEAWVAAQFDKAEEAASEEIKQDEKELVGSEAAKLMEELQAAQKQPKKKADFPPNVTEEVEEVLTGEVVPDDIDWPGEAPHA